MAKTIKLLTLFFMLSLLIFLLPVLTKPANAATFTLSGPIINGNNTVFSITPAAGSKSTLAILETGYVSPVIPPLATSVTWTAPGPGTYTAVLLLFTAEISNRATFQISGGGGSIGTITPPASVPNPPDAIAFTAGLIRNGISLLILVAFITDLLFTIFAGFRFITAGGDEKAVSSAWSQIYYGLIGMLVVMGSYAIIRLVETFFGVDIITGGLKLP